MTGVLNTSAKVLLLGWEFLKTNGSSLGSPLNGTILFLKIICGPQIGIVRCIF